MLHGLELQSGAAITYLSFSKAAPFRSQIVDDALGSTRQSHAADQQDCQHQVRESCGEVHDLEIHQIHKYTRNLIYS